MLLYSAEPAEMCKRQERKLSTQILQGGQKALNIKQKTEITKWSVIMMS
jgi:hypothetical protein